MKKALFTCLLAALATSSFSGTPDKVMSVSEFHKTNNQAKVNHAVWKTVAVNVQKFGTVYKLAGSNDMFFRCAKSDGKMSEGDFHAQLDRYEAPTEDADGVYVVGNCL